MKISRPLGSRILVEDIITTLSIEQRAKNAGFVAIVNEDNRPKSTQGRVIAVGTDPLLQDEIHLGDVVSFSYLSGTRIYIDEHEFRSLEFNEIIMVTREEHEEPVTTVTGLTNDGTTTTYTPGETRGNSTYNSRFDDGTDPDPQSGAA